MDIIEQVKFWVSCLNPKTFKEVMAKDKGKGDLIDACRNILISAAIMAIPIGLALVILSLLVAEAIPSYFGMPGPVLVVLYVLLMVIIAPISFLLSQGVYWIIAKALGGKGEYKKQAYLASFVMAGIYILSILGVIPCLGSIVALALLALMIYLEYLLIVNVHKLSSFKAALAVLAPIIVGVLIYLALLLYFTPVMVSGGPVPVPLQ